MKKLMLGVCAAALIAIPLVGYSVAGTDSKSGERLSDAQVRTLLEKQGYEIIRLEHDDDEIEVYVKRDGVTWELELDPVTGKTLEQERKD
ncbi:MULTISPECIES: PepSY domain-containing protein [Nisaea]|uniref:PepSY domain-containing protein n=1 Tax=Nisaea TaxID=390876 RepID=UPI0003F72633|nr:MULTISPECIES: PepSY domain-containing protein [Nisaea]